jgi:hypothetical protein
VRDCLSIQYLIEGVLLVSFRFELFCFDMFSFSNAHTPDAAAKEVGISDLLKEEGDIVPIADIQITVVNELLFGNRSNTKKSKIRTLNDDTIPFISS